MDIAIRQTERMHLCRITHNDLEELVRLDSDPDVMRYIGPVRTRQEVEYNLFRIIEHYPEEQGLGVWALRLKSTGQFIGWGALKYLDQTELIEVGYRLHQQFWGKGYASEFSRAILDYGFAQLGLKRIVGITHPQHLASQRILEKVGLEYVRMDRFYDSEVKYYEITRDKWQTIDPK